MSGWVRERLLGPAEAPWRTIAAARTEIAGWAGADDASTLERLAKIATWLNQLEAAAIG